MPFFIANKMRIVLTSSCPSHGGFSLFILFLCFWRNTESSNQGKRTNFVIFLRSRALNLLTFPRRPILLFVKEKAFQTFIHYPVSLGHNKWMFDRIMFFFSQISAILLRVVTYLHKRSSQMCTVFSVE